MPEPGEPGEVGYESVTRNADGTSTREWHSFAPSAFHINRVDVRGQCGGGAPPPFDLSALVSHLAEEGRLDAVLFNTYNLDLAACQPLYPDLF